MRSHILSRPSPWSLAPGQPQHILLIDDDEAISESLSARLDRQGYQVSIAETGREGIELAQSIVPTLVVLDLRLPDMHGWAVAEQLSDHPITRHVPLIMLSGMERPDIIRRSRAAGCQYFVRKPYDPNALLVLIQHAIGEVTQWEAV